MSRPSDDVKHLRVVGGFEQGLPMENGTMPSRSPWRTKSGKRIFLIFDRLSYLVLRTLPMGIR